MRNKDRAITLLEIIIVLIILGVLAVIALNLYQYVEVSRANEALLVEKNIADQVDNCINAGDNAYNCLLKNGGQPIPGPGNTGGYFPNESNAHFIFSWYAYNSTQNVFPFGYSYDAASSVYIISAMRNIPPIFPNHPQGRFCGPSFGLFGIDFQYYSSSTAGYIALCHDQSGNRTMDYVGFYKNKF